MSQAERAVAPAPLYRVMLLPFGEREWEEVFGSRGTQLECSAIAAHCERNGDVVRVEPVDRPEQQDRRPYHERRLEMPSCPECLDPECFSVNCDERGELDQ